MLGPHGAEGGILEGSEHSVSLPLSSPLRKLEWMEKISPRYAVKIEIMTTLWQNKNIILPAWGERKL